MLFSRGDRTYQLELTRDDRAIVEQVHVGNQPPQRREHPTLAAALAAYRARIGELIGDGWSVAQAIDDVAWPIASDPAMEAAIRDAVDDRAERLAVYADWLIERGDPCGEVASLRGRGQRLADDDPERARLEQAACLVEEAHPDAVYGPILALQPGPAWTWRDGWIDGLRVERSSGMLLTLALHAPMARFVRRLVLNGQLPPDLGPALAMWPRRAQLRELVIDRRSYHAHEVYEALPALERMWLVAGSVRHGHPALRSLTVSIVERGALPLAGTWPELTALALNFAGNPPRLAHVLGEAELPALRELMLAGSVTTAVAIAGELADHPIAAQLRRLWVAGPLPPSTQRALAAFPELKIRIDL